MKEISYNEIHKILVNHHKAYKNAVVLNEKEEIPFYIKEQLK